MLVAAAVLVAAVAAAGYALVRGGRSSSRVVTDGPSAIRAAFAARSYEPGAGARLVVTARARRLAVRIFHVGPEEEWTRRNDELKGVPITATRTLRWAPGGATRGVAVRVRGWPSGLYFARLAAPDGRVGFAPFVVRPRRLGESRVLVVLPTNTWQAYNFRDVDEDGVGDTWYADSDIDSVDLTRPFLDRGVPPHFRGYDYGFVRWLAHTGKRPDVVADDDLERLSARALHRLYDLVVFSGHEEYVTPHVYDAILRYRNLGGNLAFLSANNFFYRVERRGHRLYRTDRWRDIGRPEGRLTGAGYVGWFEDKWRNGPYAVVGTRAAPWLFRGTGVRDGDRFGTYGIEIDRRDGSSPRGTIVLARARDLFGKGRSAEMTYYETPRGAKVFSAGVMNFGGSSSQPVPSRLLENLWRRLSAP